MRMNLILSLQCNASEFFPSVFFIIITTLKQKIENINIFVLQENTFSVFLKMFHLI